MNNKNPCLTWDNFSSHVHSEWKIEPVIKQQFTYHYPSSFIDNVKSLLINLFSISLKHSQTSQLDSTNNPKQNFLTSASNFLPELPSNSVYNPLSLDNTSQKSPSHNDSIPTSSTPLYSYPPPEQPKLTFLQSLYSRTLSWFALRHWRVKILIHALTAMKAPVTLLIVPCSSHSTYSAGYSPPHHTIWMCINRLWTPNSYRRALTHELIHAFDFTRANLIPYHCPHVACTEIRAYHLSQQCGFLPTLGKREFEDYPGAFHLSKEASKRDRCIIHHTMISLNDHPHCKNLIKEDLENIIDNVYKRCISDYWPFLGPAEQDSSWRPSRLFFKERE